MSILTNGAPRQLILPGQGFNNAAEEARVKQLACTFLDLAENDSARVLVAACAVAAGNTMCMRYDSAQREQTFISAIEIMRHFKDMKPA
jgi:hypothetical protein